MFCERGFRTTAERRHDVRPYGAHDVYFAHAFAHPSLSTLLCKALVPRGSLLSRECVYFISAEGAVYHQCRALHIIKPKRFLFYARLREMIYKGQALDDIQMLAAFDDIPNLALLRFG